MANELLITDVVDKKAIADLAELNKHLLQTKDNYVAVVESIGKGISAPVKNFDDLTNKAKGYEDAMKQLADAQKQIITIQQQYNNLLNSINQKVKEAVQAEKQRKQAKQSYVLSLKEALALANQEVHSINEANEANKRLRATIRTLRNDVQEEVEAMKVLNDAIDRNSEVINQNSDAYTRQKRNVGNYASAWNGLGMSVQQLARELPALSMGFNTFFLAISNNLPILADEIKRARMEFQAMQAAGEKGIPVWKQLVGAILNWQTALVVGITVLSMYGKEIAAWVKGLFDGSKGLKDLKEAQNDVNESIIKGGSGLGNSLYILNELVKKWKELGDDLEKQNEFIKENREEFDKLGVSITNINEAENLFVTNTDSYVRALMLRAKAAAAAKLAQEEYEKEIKRQMKADAEAADTPDIIDRIKSSYVNFGMQLGQNYSYNWYSPKDAQSDRVAGLREEAKAANENAQAYQNMAIALEEEAKALLNSVQIRERNNDLTGGGYSPFVSKLTGNNPFAYLVHDDSTIDKLASEYVKKVNQAIADNLEATSNQYSWFSVRESQYMSLELDELAEQYTQGLIQKEEYEKKKAEITERYGIRQTELALELLKEQLATGNLPEEVRYQLEQEIAKKEIELAEKVRDAKVNAVKETSKEIKMSFEDVLSYASEAIGSIGDLADSFSERELEKLEREQKANDEAYEKDIERIQKLEETGAISKEEAEARKRAAEEQTAAREKDLERQRQQIRERQAKYDKAVSISQAIIATALGILQTIKNVGMPAAIPFIALQSALGAIQLATIISQPIPKYAKGTKDHKGGLAIVGDGGKREAVFMDGNVYATPDVPTLVNLPKHAVVMPDLSKITSAEGLNSDLMMLIDKKNKRNSEGVVVNVNNDYTKLERRMNDNSNKLEEIKKLLKKQNRSTDRAMIYGRL